MTIEQPHQGSLMMATTSEPPVTRTVLGVETDTTRLDRVPTPRGPQRPDALSPAGRRRAARAAIAVVAVAGMVGTGLLAAQRAEAVTEQRAADLRVSQSVTSLDVDLAALNADTATVAASTGRTQRDALSAAAAQAVQDAGAVAGASPHAGETLTTLSAASAAVSATAADARYSPVVLRGQLAALGTASAQTVAAETAWQVAEQARIAAEQARIAAERAARAAAATHPTSHRKSSSTRTSTSTGGSGGAASTGTVHAVTLRCTEASGAGSAASAGAVGSGINSWRASQGLPALSISTSGTLTTHALNMAASGGIWHSGSDNIVGCAGSVSSLVNAWANSPGHRAQMVRTDVSSMSIGAATDGRYLYSAVKFR